MAGEDGSFSDDALKLAEICSLPVYRIPRKDSGPLSLEKLILAARDLWSEDLDEVLSHGWLNRLIMSSDVHPDPKYVKSWLDGFLDTERRRFFKCPSCLHNIV